MTASGGGLPRNPPSTPQASVMPSSTTTPPFAQVPVSQPFPLLRLKYEPHRPAPPTSVRHFQHPPFCPFPCQAAGGPSVEHRQKVENGLPYPFTNFHLLRFGAQGQVRKVRAQLLASVDVRLVLPLPATLPDAVFHSFVERRMIYNPSQRAWPS